MIVLAAPVPVRGKVLATQSGLVAGKLGLNWHVGGSVDGSVTIEVEVVSGSVEGVEVGVVVEVDVDSGTVDEEVVDVLGDDDDVVGSWTVVVGATVVEGNVLVVVVVVGCVVVDVVLGNVVEVEVVVDPGHG